MNQITIPSNPSIPVNPYLGVLLTSSSQCRIHWMCTLRGFAIYDMFRCCACSRLLQSMTRQLRAHMAGQGRGRAAVALPPTEVALLLASELPFLLRLLLQNDSLQDIGARQALYREVMDLMRVLSSSMDTVEALCVATDDPEAQAREAVAAAEAAARKGATSAVKAVASAAGAAPSQDHSLLGVLQRLNTQVRIATMMHGAPLRTRFCVRQCMHIILHHPYNY